jgi:hypothetical protein
MHRPSHCFLSGEQLFDYPEKPIQLSPMKKFYLLLLFGFPYSVGFSQSAGFFLNEGSAKEAVIPPFQDAAKPAVVSTVTIDTDFDSEVTPVSPYLFGNNANVYMTQAVDQPTLLSHITKLSPGVIRFPGGNISSVYFWNANKNQPPADAPAKLVDGNTGSENDPGYWYGKNTEGWTMSVDNYYEMLRLTNNTGIITVNYGYARYSTAADPVAVAAHLAAEWVRYDNGRTRFWEIGNESNGTWQAGNRINTANNKDGQPQIITGALYGKHFKVFADSMKKAAAEKGVAIYIGAQLLQEAPANWWTDTDRHWNEGVFQQSGNTPDYYIIHSYYTPFQTNSNPSEILNSATTVTRDMMSYVSSQISQAGVDSKPIALTEWNIFAEGSKQQASFINGMHASIVLGELMKNKYGLACRWDLANGWSNGNDHGLFSQGDEPGVPRWHPRAAYYYLYYFRKYFGDQLIDASVTGNSNVIAYASRFSSGHAGIVVINKGETNETVRVNIRNFGYGERFYVYSLTGGTDNGKFSLKVSVNGVGNSLPSGGPADVESVKANAFPVAGGVMISSPARSVQHVLVENGDNVITGNELSVAEFLKVYPNPVINILKIELPSEGFHKIEITTLQGEKVHSSEIDPAVSVLEVKNVFASGIYLIRLSKGKKILNRKIIIN